MMLNKLLYKQVQEYLGDIENVPAPWSLLLQGISNTYDEYEKSGEIVLEDNNTNDYAIKEQNTRLKLEAIELKKAHNELGRILDSVNHGFFSRDMTTNSYTYLSHACEKIYGYDVHEFFENSLLWYDVILPEDKVIIERDDERLKKGEQVYTQYRVMQKNGLVKWIELTIIPQLFKGKLVRVDGVVNDITQRKKVEAEREMMMKELMKSNADLKQFSYITSHNLRSPLSNILAISNMLDFNDCHESNKEMLSMLKISAQQLNKTIDDLTKILIIKNNVNPELTCLSLQELFQEVIQTFLNALHDIEGEVVTKFEAPYVSVNKVYLESIFINLISNAIKYRSADRKLLIKVSSSLNEGGDVVMRFADNGSGIDLNRHKEKVFGLYQRFHTNIEGQGLGLFIMKSQIEATGGKIDIESEAGKGTTFILQFKSDKRK